MQAEDREALSAGQARDPRLVILSWILLQVEELLCATHFPGIGDTTVNKTIQTPPLMGPALCVETVINVTSGHHVRVCLVAKLCPTPLWPHRL